MDLARLKGLAAHLRASRITEAVLSHGQALDAIAAIAGVRDWSGVSAFPQRVTPVELDLSAASRLTKRLQRDHAVQILPETLLHLLELAEFHAKTPSRHGTERLVVTTCDSAAGCVKASRIADDVVAFVGNRVSGPVPPAFGPVAFFEAREAAVERDPERADELHEWDRAVAAVAAWNGLVASCRRFERVELWIGPTPNEQLLGVQLIDGLSHEPDVLARLYLVHAADPLGELSPARIHTMEPDVVAVGKNHVALAAHAWAAYRSPTPEACVGLLRGDRLAALPFLERSIRTLLSELPAADTGLGATERLLLDVVAPGGVKPFRFFHVNARENPARVYDLFDEIRIVNRLASGRRPAIDGLHDSTFDARGVMDSARRERYMDCELSLSDLGRRLHEGADDYARENVVHRWWGGTLLTNEHLWRWDAAIDRLVSPR